MKRIAILTIALASMGGGCWSGVPVKPSQPVAPTPPQEQPYGNDEVKDMKVPEAVVSSTAPLMAPSSTTSAVIEEKVPSVEPVPLPSPAPKVVQPAPKPEEPVYVVIEMSQDGFKPAQIAIKKNTIVRFKNVGEDPIWPASNPHPAHTAYQDFDARRMVKPGETYEFTFKNVGTWGCHDHLSPGLSCRIVVGE